MTDNEKPEEPIEPTVMIGRMAFKLSEVLDADNRPEVKQKIEEWLAKKEKAYHLAQKRKGRPRLRKG